ncbi:hypothetical protein TIFTF001_007876 [Ficus carica]|uniref:Uncharacterized protein n=1 Tax=Ficus carica TaxID=3494 RepID=A0AA88A3R2_FICCA|nr:hypothetical protein TIFTF001_007876 [Ficus carica]
MARGVGRLWGGASNLDLGGTDRRGGGFARDRTGGSIAGAWGSSSLGVHCRRTAKFIVGGKWASSASWGEQG